MKTATQKLLTLLDLVTDRTPEATALRTPTGTVTYRAVRDRVRALGGWLQAQGVEPGDVVAYRCPRETDMVALALATISVGAAFTYLDEAFPPARTRAMLDVVRPRLVVDATSDRELEVSAGDRYVALGTVDADDEVLQDTTDLNAPAQVVFTSGSRGTPKAVVISQAAILNRLSWMWTEHPFEAGNVLALHKSPALVAAPWEMFGGLLASTETVIVDAEVAVDPHLMWPFLVEHRVTHLFASPALVEALLAEADVDASTSALRFVTTSAETLRPELARRMVKALPSAVLLNLYGLSECSSNVAAYDLRDLPEGAGYVPLGTPIAQSQIVVVDGRLRPVPVGIEGEMLVGGPCLALGYVGNDDLTGSRFLDVDFGEGPERMVRTGDRARMRRDGILEFCGRTDDQVQVRGFRVELGDIEATLLRLPGVSAAAVRADDGADGAGARIRAWVEAPEGLEVTTLQSYVQSELPSYMQLNDCQVLRTLPRTRSGKIDMVELEDRDVVDDSGAAQLDLPQGPIEEAVASVWCAVLGREGIGASDNFFDLGGHSLLATKVASRLRAAFEVPLKLRAIFENPTVRGLSAELEKQLVASLEAVPS